MNENDIAEAAKALAMKSMAKGTFSFADMLRDRTYPEITTPVYVDEAKALRLVELLEEESALDEKVLRSFDGASAEQTEAYNAIDKERADIRESLAGSGYTATVRGFDPDDWESMSEQAKAEYPEEFEEGSVNPLTGRTIRIPIPSPGRSRYLAALVWQKAIVRIERHDGAIIEDMSVEDWMIFASKLPQGTRAHLDETIQKVQLSADWYKGLTDEVF